MKFLIYGCITICMFFLVQEKEKTTVTAFYDGFEDGTFYFTSVDDISYEFQYVEEDVLEKYNLKNTDWNGKTFRVTYTASTVEEDDEEYEVYTIVDLKEEKD